MSTTVGATQPRGLLQITLSEKQSKAAECENCGEQFGFFGKGHKCSRCYRTLCTTCPMSKVRQSDRHRVTGGMGGAREGGMPGSVYDLAEHYCGQISGGDTKICQPCVEERKRLEGIFASCSKGFARDSTFALTWLRYLNVSREEAAEDFSRSLKAGRCGGKDTIEDVSRVIESMEMGNDFEAVSLNFSFFDIAEKVLHNKERVDVKEAMVDTVIALLGAEQRLHVTRELLRAVFVMLLLCSPATAVKVLKAYYQTVVPKQFIEAPKVQLDLVIGRLLTVMPKSLKYEELCECAVKYWELAMTFLTNAVTFENWIDFVTSVLIEKSFARVEQAVLRGIARTITEKKLPADQISRCILYAPKAALFEGGVQEPSATQQNQQPQASEMLLTLTTEEEEEHEEKDSSNSKQKVLESRRRRQDAIIKSDSFYAQENIELKGKLAERNETVKQLQQRLFTVSSQPRQQDRMKIEKLSTDNQLLAKKFADSQVHIRYLTHKLATVAKDQQQQQMLLRERGKLKDEASSSFEEQLKDLSIQLKKELVEEVQTSVKEQLRVSRKQSSDAFKRTADQDSRSMHTPSSSICSQPPLVDNEETNGQTTATTTALHRGNMSSDFAFNKSFLSAIGGNTSDSLLLLHSRQFSSQAEFSSILGGFSQTSHQRQTGQSSSSPFARESVKEVNRSQLDIIMTDDDSHDGEQTTSVHEADERGSDDKCKPVNIQVQEEDERFSAALFDRLEKVQALLLSDQRILSELLFFK